MLAVAGTVIQMVQSMRDLSQVPLLRDAVAIEDLRSAHGWWHPVRRHRARRDVKVWLREPDMVDVRRTYVRVQWHIRGWAALLGAAMVTLGGEIVKLVG